MLNTRKNSFMNLEDHLLLMESNLSQINTERAIISKRFKELSSVPQEFGVPTSANPQLEIPLSETLDKIKEYRADNYQKLKERNPKLLHELNGIIDYLTKGDMEEPYKKKKFNLQDLENHQLNFDNGDGITNASTALNSKIMANKERKRKKRKKKKHDSDSEESEHSFILPYDGDYQDFKNSSEPYQMLFQGNDKNQITSNLASLPMDLMIPGMTQNLITQSKRLTNLHSEFLAQSHAVPGNDHLRRLRLKIEEEKIATKKLKNEVKQTAEAVKKEELHRRVTRELRNLLKQKEMLERRRQMVILRQQQILKSSFGSKPYIILTFFLTFERQYSELESSSCCQPPS